VTDMGSLGYSSRPAFHGGHHTIKPPGQQLNPDFAPSPSQALRRTSRRSV
jgi:hypothetical protein